MLVAARFCNTGLRDFWSALPNAYLSTDRKILSLVKDTFFLGNRNYGDKLLIRNCYLGIIEVINNYYAGKVQGVVVIGNQGA
jgi:hypothetical protein